MKAARFPSLQTEYEKKLFRQDSQGLPDEDDSSRYPGLSLKQ
jgi:hypothetical protein